VASVVDEELQTHSVTICQSHTHWKEQRQEQAIVAGAWSEVVLQHRGKGEQECQQLSPGYKSAPKLTLPLINNNSCADWRNPHGITVES